MRDVWLPAHSSLWLRVRITTTKHPELTPPLRRGSSSVKKTTHRSSTSILWYRLLTPPLPRVLHLILPILAKIAPTPIPTCSSILLVICSISRDWSCDRSDRLSRMFWIRGFWTFCRSACPPLLLLAWRWGSRIWDRIGLCWICCLLWGFSLQGWWLVVIGLAEAMILSLSFLFLVGASRFLTRTLHCWMIYIIILNLAYYLELFNYNS